MSSTTTNMATPTPPADPFNQSFTLLYPDGTPFTVSISDLDSWYTYSVLVSIEYASQLGATITLLIVLLLLTKPDKRFSPIFLINASALLLNFIRLVLQCVYFGGPLNEAYVSLSSDYSTISPSTWAISIAAEVLILITTILVEFSLLLQTHVVCLTLRRVYRNTLLALSTIMASVCIGWRFYFAVFNIQVILGTENSIAMLDKLQVISNFVTTASIFWFSCVFVAKLGHAIHRRRKLGLRKWGSMQIIFTMGCQTLIIPALFSALQYLSDFPALGSFVLSLVVLFLPLSSIWASASVEANTAPKHPTFVMERKAPMAAKKDSLSEGSTTWYSPTTDGFSGTQVGGIAV